MSLTPNFNDIGLPILSKETINRRDRKTLTQITIKQRNHLHLSRLETLACSQFEWRGFTGDMNRRYLERKLYELGSVAFGEMTHAPGRVIHHPYRGDGNIDQYGELGALKLINARGENVDVSSWEIMRDSSKGLPMRAQMEAYAAVLTYHDVVYEANLKQQLRPYIFSGSEKLSNTFANIFDDIENFAPYVQLSDKISRDNFDILLTGATFQGLSIQEAKRGYWAEALGILGISSETTKKERLIADEVVINRQEDTVLLNSRLMERVEAAEKINERWGLNLTVNMSDVPASFNMVGNEDQAAARQGLGTSNPDRQEDREESNGSSEA